MSSRQIRTCTWRLPMLSGRASPAASNLARARHLNQAPSNDGGPVHCLLPLRLCIVMHMRKCSFLFVGLLCSAAPALAQVTVDLHALDGLPGAKPAGKE